MHLKMIIKLYEDRPGEQGIKIRGEPGIRRSINFWPVLYNRK